MSYWEGLRKAATSYQSITIIILIIIIIIIIIIIMRRYFSVSFFNGACSSFQLSSRKKTSLQPPKIAASCAVHRLKPAENPPSSMRFPAEHFHLASEELGYHQIRQVIDHVGGFHSHGGTPKNAGWFFLEKIY